MADKSSDELSARAAATATVSSLNSDHSSEHLITSHAPKPKENITKPKPTKSITTSGSEKKRRGRRLVVLLGLSQVAVGALLVGAGALGVVKGAALARVGAGLWAGCVAVVAGVVGVLAGINDCYGLNGNASGASPLLTGFLALSLLCLACGNGAAVLAAAGLQRDARRPPAHHSFQDEMDAWTPVLANIALLVVAAAHCALSVASIYHAARRACACLRPRRPYDHNQFEPQGKQAAPYVVHVDERAPQKAQAHAAHAAHAQAAAAAERARRHDLCKDLEGKLGADKHRKKEEQQFGSANSRERLVSSWLGSGGAAARGAGGGAGGAGAAGRVRKPRPPQPLVLVPAHPASTLGRMPVSVMVPPRYATLPLPPYAPPFAPPPHHPHPHPHHPQFYPVGYPVHDPRLVRRVSPARQGGARRRRRREARDRDSQLTRSLERIHRKRAERERRAEVQLRSTYTGLDRAYAEQFIAVCDESRSQAHERSDSLTSSESEPGAPPPPPPPAPPAPHGQF